MFEISQLFNNIGTGVITATAALAGIFLTNRENNKRLALQLNNENNKHREVMREKLEELYVQFRKWSLSVEYFYEDHISFLKGKIDLEALQNLAYKRENNFDFNRIEMLINLYFPDLLPIFDELKKSFRLDAYECFTNRTLNQLLSERAEFSQKVHILEDLIIKQSYVAIAPYARDL